MNLSKARTRGGPLLAIVLAVWVSVPGAQTVEVDCDLSLLASEGANATALPESTPLADNSALCSGSCVTASHIYLFEDTAGVLVDPTSDGNDEALLKAQAANELIALYGDRFDFIGFWTNFDPTTRSGGANFRTVFNTAGGFGMGPIDSRAGLGLNSNRVQGFITMYDLHQTANWDLNVTLDHEFGHRWLVFMNPLLDGRVMRRGSHAQCALDVQGGMHAVDWFGTNKPKLREPANNVDTGVVWGWLHLYLMGYAAPGEVQTGMSEQRYMDQSVDICPNQPYTGPISFWTVQDIIDANGPRVPDSIDSRKDFRTGWVLIHQPGNLPTPGELADIAALLDGYCDRWDAITLGRGKMTQTLFNDCDCSGVPGGGCPGCLGDLDCDDGVFCNGAEICDVPSGNCFPGSLPCEPGEFCNEAIDACEACNDGDGDGFGVPGTAACPGGASLDCDDSEASVYPGAPEICDGLANDCTSFAWPTVPNDEIDSDGDGYVTCTPWVGANPAVLGGGDCDPGEPSTYPGAVEVNDGLDNQCPGDPGFGVADETSGDSGFHTLGDTEEYCWDAQAGATEYEVQRSPSPAFDGGCTGVTTSATCWTDAGVPAAGGLFFYLNRPLAPNTGSWGQDSARAERTGVCP